MTSRHAVATVAWPLLFGAIFLALWEAVVQIFDLKPYFLPSPSSILEAFVDNFGIIWDATVYSGTNALIGLIAGTVLGVAVSFLLVRFRFMTELVTPLAVALNAIPIVVLVTVFLNMYGATSDVPRRLMVTLIVFFIVLVNVAKGLRQVSPTHLELLRSYAAPPTAVLLKARILNAVPYLFTALKIAAPASVITAFVSEYRWTRHRPRSSNPVQLRELLQRGGVGLRARRPPVGVDVLPDLHGDGVHHQDTDGAPPRGRSMT
ncbi:MAG: hypothetical protein R2697_20890 [Ilumatobacteraceae bacterium]